MDQIPSHTSKVGMHAHVEFKLNIDINGLMWPKNLLFRKANCQIDRHF